jgi:hypothetical protein
MVVRRAIMYFHTMHSASMEYQSIRFGIKKEVFKEYIKKRLA